MSLAPAPATAKLLLGSNPITQGKSGLKGRAKNPCLIHGEGATLEVFEDANRQQRSRGNELVIQSDMPSQAVIGY